MEKFNVCEERLKKTSSQLNKERDRKKEEQEEKIISLVGRLLNFAMEDFERQPSSRTYSISIQEEDFNTSYTSFECRNIVEKAILEMLGHNSPVKYQGYQPGATKSLGIGQIARILFQPERMLIQGTWK